MDAVLPMILLLALGWGLARARILSAPTLTVLGNFVVSISLPAMLFAAVAALAQGGFRGADPRYFIAYGGASVLVFGLMLMLSVALAQRHPAGRRSLGMTPSMAPYVGVASAGPNSAFIAFPILAVLLPDVANSILVMNLIIENVLLLPLFLLSLNFMENRGHGLLHGLRLSVQRLLRSPLIWAIVLAAIPAAGSELMGVALAWPSGLVRASQLLGQASIGIALVCIGGNLAQSSAPGVASLARAWPILGKLVLHPLAVGLAVFWAYPLPSDLAKAAVLAALSPTFSVFPMFAQQSGLQVWASQVLLISTLLSLAMLSVASSIIATM